MASLGGKDGFSGPNDLEGGREERKKGEGGILLHLLLFLFPLHYVLHFTSEDIQVRKEHKEDSCPKMVRKYSTACDTVILLSFRLKK